MTEREKLEVGNNTLEKDISMGLPGPKRHTDRVGDVSEAAIAARLLQAGYVVLTPKPQTKCISFR